MAASPATTAPPDHGPARPWLSCVGPFVLFLVLGLLEPVAGDGGLAGLLGIPRGFYPAIYGLRLAITAILLAACWPALGGWLGRPSWWPPLVGLALVVPWIVLAGLQREAGWGASATRAAFDPFLHYGDSTALVPYLVVRGLGLVVIVPIVEELFLRGFLMRYVIDDERFWAVPYGTVTAAALVACTVYAAATHPSEAVAAVGWFGITSGIAAATRRPIDSILAHAATNLALGGYVLATGSWWLV